MSFHSFSGANSTPAYGMGSSSSAVAAGGTGNALGEPLSRMHSLDPNSYPLLLSTYAAPHIPPATSGSAVNTTPPGSVEGIASTFYNKVSTANSIPLLEYTPGGKLVGGKRHAEDAEASTQDKKIKMVGAALSRLPSIDEEQEDIGKPLGTETIKL